ncbi:hypothetical protein [Paraburkholderia phenoliruptrix]|uniref:hypothetical protein n=1 Tax=Paraburkholderia phenoliruptrix TaxID=252970 RepID=UPI0034CD3724
MEQDAAVVDGENAVNTATAVPAVPLVSLDEFCSRLSARDRRVELIAGFHHVEKAAKKFKDVESNYQARFSAFVNKPVGG